MGISKTCISIASLLPWDELERLGFDKIAFSFQPRERARQEQEALSRATPSGGVLVGTTGGGLIRFPSLETSSSL